MSGSMVGAIPGTFIVVGIVVLARILLGYAVYFCSSRRTSARTNSYGFCQGLTSPRRRRRPWAGPPRR